MHIFMQAKKNQCTAVKRYRNTTEAISY